MLCHSVLLFYIPIQNGSNQSSNMPFTAQRP